ncbi:hypothetical protein Csac_2660 [Caldicellulosiruptor saccharolyticus DSM 8903]|uniref:Uncharacterized protein n=1 Tax=Caldicellulosiruptor saccharolyticus (strain ATCC 43494 / DSM 8903 / Tp8T 6331) TaxID=351627 RepID=A4XMU6_CALS8|nr:hypothetical protein [Caldicellulosiruptor saccharolyticus]ABP68231.1 hypothetical protein Csac_2660 [Caldicellulosiruptor saccharolyticus DSM 8903]
MIKKIISRLEPFDDWVNNTSEEENLAARDALKEFLWQIKDLKPSSEYAKSSITQLHTSYILHLIAIKKALVQKKYTRVCNEIITLLNKEPFMQPRVLNNLINLLAEELNK